MSTPESIPSTAAPELENLYAAFTDEVGSPDTAELVHFAETSLDFRAGRPREETPWNEGANLTDVQKEATVDVARKWSMLATTYPTRPFDSIVVLGAHHETLRLRTQHAADIQSTADEMPDLLMLSCFRPIHPKEGIDLARIDTETDLAIELLQEQFMTRFDLESIASWNDLPDDSEQNNGEYAVAFVGRVGLQRAVVISGSVPSVASRATTLSTLESLRTYLEESKERLLFVTTSLHLPYQALQVESVMGPGHEVVGIGYPGLQELSVDSPDSNYRAILQEIGATIKNSLIL